MANISDLSGDEREQRIAELKQKMQDAARKKQEAQAADAAEADSSAESDADAQPEAVAEAPAQPIAEAADAEAEPAATADAIEAADENIADDSASQDAPATKRFGCRSSRGRGGSRRGRAFGRGCCKAGQVRDEPARVSCLFLGCSHGRPAPWHRRRQLPVHVSPVQGR